jgi:hypothetical protein
VASQKKVVSPVRVGKKKQQVYVYFIKLQQHILNYFCVYFITGLNFWSLHRSWYRNKEELFTEARGRLEASERQCQAAAVATEGGPRKRKRNSKYA